MLYPIKVVEIELSQSIPDFQNLDAYFGLKALIRLHGVPLGYVDAPILLGCCMKETLSTQIIEQLSCPIIRQLLKNGLTAPDNPENSIIEDLLKVPPVPFEGEMLLVTVAVCTRDRPDNMKLCLEALRKLDYPFLDIVVVDNAPQTEATKELVELHFPEVRYVREPRPGLDWARNRAILEAKGEIIAYTDDDVVVDPSWVRAIALNFLQEPMLMGLTGLVVPYELETEAQVLFEEYGGFGKGFQRQVYRVPEKEKLPWWMLGAGQYGTGANMAFRVSVFQDIGGFDPALDVGTVTNGGGDLEMFFRVIKEHHLFIYAPEVIVRHRHRQSYDKLKSQIINNGIGLYSYFMSGIQYYPDQFFGFLYIGLYWFISWHIRRAWITFKHPTKIPGEFVWGEILGVFKGLRRYQKAKHQVQDIIDKSGGLVAEQVDCNTSRILFFKQDSNLFAAKISKSDRSLNPPCSRAQLKIKSTAVRTVYLQNPIEAILDIIEYPETRIFFVWGNQLLGSEDIKNNYQSIDADRLIDLVVQRFSTHPFSQSPDNYWTNLEQQLVKQFSQGAVSKVTPLPQDIKVSINLATFDRPDDLRNCLACLQKQVTGREVEIIVVDNHPESHLTPPVIAEFSNIKLIDEPRQGLAYARNAGFLASTGDIIIATDDDVTIPEDWLEKLVAPFSRSDVMIVTGNVLPVELETQSQQFFEKYGGLGRGFEPFEADANWFESSPRYAIPTWRLGATANAAFRSTILSDPKIGLMDEALGPGMPSGVGEDTYLFYKTIKAGYTLLYEPSAFLWHKHRQDMSSLRRQLYGYSKGHVSYNLTTALRDHDLRGIYQILVALPIYHVYRLVNFFLGRSDYPLSLILLEMWGNLAGPWSLWRSRIRVRREGCSTPISRSSTVVEPTGHTVYGNEKFSGG